MAHKVHPKGCRIRYTQDGDARWIEKRYSSYRQVLREDFLIREHIYRKLKESAIEKVDIERFSRKIHVIIYSARPGLIIGRGGSGVEELRKAIEKILRSVRKNGDE